MNQSNCTLSNDPRVGSRCVRSLRNAARVATQFCGGTGRNLSTRVVRSGTVGLQRSLQRGLSIACFAISVALLLSTSGFGQLSTASVNGVVRDPSGAVITNARIVLANVDTSIQNTTLTNGAGAYAFLDVQPGRYTLEATASGFKPEKLSAFTLTVSQIADIDFSLAVGATTSAITVEATTPQLEVASASLGTVIETKQVDDLPLNGRNFTELLLLSPGVSSANTSQNSSGFAPEADGSTFSFPAVNGQSNRSDFFLMDGLSNYGTFYSVYAVPPIIDAIQEFKMVSHTDNAEFGSVLGGVVDVVTKSGTNQFHGSAWEFTRNSVFDARSYFLPKTQPTTPFHQNQFGGSFGGPVLIPRLYNGRSKTFFFGAYQGFRYYKFGSANLHVPTTAQLSGDESDWPTQIYNPFSTRPDPANPGQYIRDPFPGNQIPLGLVDQSMVAWAKFVFPAAGPAIDSAGDNSIDLTPNTQTQNEWTIRADQKVGTNDSAWFRYSLINSNEERSAGLPGFANEGSEPTRNWGGSYVHVFSPRLVVQGQFGRTIGAEDGAQQSRNSTSGIISQVGFSQAIAGGYVGVPWGGTELLPGPNINGYSNASEGFGEDYGATNSYEFSGNATLILGTHELKWGAGYISNRFQARSEGPGIGFAAQETADTNPLDTENSGDPMASFVLNVPDNANRNNRQDIDTRPGGVLDAFFQDSWKAAPRLTLNYGLRYDVTYIPPYGTDASIGDYGGIETGDMDFNTGNYVLQKVPPPCSVRGHAPCIPGNGTLPDHVVVDPRGKIAFNSYTGFGPRLGFAYRIGDRTVVKGGFGILYDSWATITQLLQDIGGAWPDLGNEQASNFNQPTSASPTPTLTAQNPLPLVLPPPTPFTTVGTFFDPHLKPAYSDQWTFGVQRQLSKSTAVTLMYVGSASKHLLIPGQYNTALTPGPGDYQLRAPFPYMVATYYARSVGTGSYNAGEITLDRRFTNGLSYQISYTRSKAIDIVGDDLWGGFLGPTDPYHPAANGERSVAGYDQPNILALNILYELPFGSGKSLSTGNSALNYILGNWQFNNIFRAFSGQPFTPFISSDIANTGNQPGMQYEHLNLVGNPHLSSRSPSEWFNTSAYAVPAGYTYGTAGRNSLRSNGYWELDTSLFRGFPVGGERQFEFRAEAFNLMNNVVLGEPKNDFNSGPSFGTINSTANQARQLQLALKFLF